MKVAGVPCERMYASVLALESKCATCGSRPREASVTLMRDEKTRCCTLASRAASATFLPCEDSVPGAAPVMKSGRVTRKRVCVPLSAAAREDGEFMSAWWWGVSIVSGVWRSARDEVVTYSDDFDALFCQILGARLGYIASDCADPEGLGERRVGQDCPNDGTPLDASGAKNGQEL
jgi:hypothetical protein